MSNTDRNMTRRDALRAIASAAACAAGVARAHAAPEPPAATKPALHVYASYGWLRGFSVVPSWGAD
jgi:hypothetical protein